MSGFYGLALATGSLISGLRNQFSASSDRKGTTESRSGTQPGNAQPETVVVTPEKAVRRHVMNRRIRSFSELTSSCRGAYTTLPAHAHQRSIGFIALVLHGLLRRGTKRLFVGILGQIAIAPNHLFAIHNANQPFGLPCVPRNFHLIGTHSHLPVHILAGSGVFRDLQNWRRGWDSNPRYGFPYAR